MTLNHLNNFSTWDDIERSGKLGSVVETWAANEITKLISVSHRKAHIYFIRLYTGQEIDKMRNLVDFFGDRLKVAIILYPGLDYIDLGSKLCLIPFSFFFGLDFTVGEKH
jgi:hypothetical protein